MCKLKKLDNNKRTDLKKDEDEEDVEEEEEVKAPAGKGAKQESEEKPVQKVRGCVS